MAAASATRKKLPMFIIDKSKNPRCFKNVNYLPCEYVVQKKNWINNQTSKAGSVNLIWNSAWIKEKLLLSLTIAQGICPFLTWKTFNLFSCPQTLRQFFRQWTKVASDELEELWVCYAGSWRKTSLVQRFQFYKQWRYLLILARVKKGNCYQPFQEGWNQLWRSAGCHCWFRRFI